MVLTHVNIVNNKINKFDCKSVTVGTDLEDNF